MSLDVRRGSPALLVSVIFLLGACDLEPDVGAPIQEICSNADSDPSVDVSFQADILEGIFSKPVTGCFECHHPESQSPIGIEIGGLDLSTYGGLRAGGVASGNDVVQPGNPCDSVVVQKVKPGPPFGNRMPRNAPPFLTSMEIGRLSDWIAEGALEN